MRVVFLFIAISFVHCQEESEGANERAEKLAEMMRHDGVERVGELSQKNIKGLLKKYNVMVVLFHTHSNETTLRQDKYALEVVAQLFQKRGIVCTTCDMVKNIGLVKEAGVLYPGTILIFNHGRLTTYTGQRSPDVMVPYVSRFLEPPVNNIVSKTGKKFFDAVQLPKVIAYIGKDSTEYTELMHSARSFQPMIQFHAVFDAKLAKSLQLKKLNSLLFIKPFEKAVKSPSNFVFKEKHISEFIRKNRRQVIRKMMLENIHEIWSHEMKGYMITVFAKIDDAVGSRFFSLVKSLAREYANNEKLNFVWIDPDPFPAMREYWQTTFNVDPTQPNIGAVDVNEQSSSWLALPEGRDVKLSDLKKWAKDLLNGKLKLTPMNRAGKGNKDETGEEPAENRSTENSGTDEREGEKEQNDKDSKNIYKNLDGKERSDL